MEHHMVQLVIEESLHYSATAPEAYLEWLWTATEGNDNIRLGPDHHVFIVAMFHEMHCLHTIQAVVEEAITRGSSGEHDEHLHHCFNYLRKWILCSADATLELGDFKSHNFEEDK